MQKLLIVSACVLVAFLGSAWARPGVGTLTPEVEAEALRLWQAHCEGDKEGGKDGENSIYCKKSGEKIEETLTHEHALTPAGEAGQQVVFVQPPSYHYKHDVVVTGGGGEGAKTVIYVKPAKNTNEVNIVDQTAPNAAPQKPTLYFLKGNHGGEEASPRSDAPAPEAVQEATPEAEAAPEADAGAARKRRQNGPESLFPATEVAAPEQKKRTVYILRRAFA